MSLVLSTMRFRECAEVTREHPERGEARFSLASLAERIGSTEAEAVALLEQAMQEGRIDGRSNCRMVSAGTRRKRMLKRRTDKKRGHPEAS